MSSHRYYEVTLLKWGFNILSLVMSDSMQNRITRGLLFVFAVVLLSGSFAASRHLFTGTAKYITYDHGLRRVLRSAERDNLRSALMVKEQGLMTHRPQQIGEVPPSPQLVATYYRISFVQHSLSDLNRLVHSLSPVLNL
jgi:hypothetical protein